MLFKSFLWFIKILLDGQKICEEVTSDKRFVEVQTKLVRYMYICYGSNLIFSLNFFKLVRNF